MTWSVAIYIQEAGGWAKKVCNDSERDESTEEQLQCNEQYKCTPHGTPSPPSPAMAMAMAMPEHPYPCMKPLKHESMPETLCDMRYTNSLTPSPTAAMVSHVSISFFQSDFESVSASWASIASLKCRAL